ncbi:helix-turn-helix domain-containing protein [Risungbinella massiliensis]|uniref:helix-turn-helix domain-containing protein n=1 Tax=Risungbinella massiliensis TaxID=1329796 RepID=UPI0005CBA2DC|nr:helix-turn-helix transcriptional regulator [Risungbinella massiliensis]
MSVEIGKQLKQAREQQGISLDEMAYSTRIDKNFLIALEKGNWDALPGPIYVKSYLRTYTLTVGLDPKQVMRQTSSIRTTKQPNTGARTPSRVGRRDREEVASIVLEEEYQSEEEVAPSRTATVPSRSERLQETTPSRLKRGVSSPNHEMQEKFSEEKSNRRIKEKGANTEKKKKKATFGVFYTRFLILIGILLLVAGGYVFWLRSSSSEVTSENAMPNWIIDKPPITSHLM